MPKVSVIISAYNSEKYIAAAIDSILNQTFNDFEVLITNDGSTDSTGEILRSYKDPRIKLFDNQVNAGADNSYNTMMKSALGDYIAKLDADDTALPHRLAKQVEFLDANKDIILCSGWAKVFKHDGSIYIDSYPQKDPEIRAAMLSYNTFVHSAVMFRKETALKNNIFYNPDKWPADDYDIFARMLRFGKAEILPEVLIHYTYHTENVTSKKYDILQKMTDLTRVEQIEYLTGELDLSEKELYLSLFHKRGPGGKVYINRALELLLKIISSNEIKNLYEKETVNKLIYYCWSYACKTSFFYGLECYNKGLKTMGIRTGLFDNVRQLFRAMKYLIKNKNNRSN